jgi:hypothetical protein
VNVPENDKQIKKPCGWQRRYADIDFKRLLPRQQAQALPDLREARLARICSRRGTHLDMYARERWGAQDQPPRRRDLHS